MTLNLARLEALAAAATPGPWRLAEVTEADTELGTYPAEKGAPLPVEHLDLYRAVRDMEPVAGAHHPERGVNVFSLGAERQENIACLVHVNPDDPNAAFIAACDPTTVQALCARIRALEAVAKAAAEYLDVMVGQERDDTAAEAASFLSIALREAREETP